MTQNHTTTDKPEVQEETLRPRLAPALSRLTSQDDSLVEHELNRDLGYPSLGNQQQAHWMQRATDRGSALLSKFRKMMRGRYEDWLFLVILGSLMGVYSFGIDVAVSAASQYRLAAFLSADDLPTRVVIWLILTALVSTSAALFVAWFIPSASGSGFPEIKAYLQGVKIENTFSPLTCVGKLVFLPIMLCTALPLGKEGPVTHVAAIFALFITKVFKDISVEELERHTGNELVAAACTMGAAVCYGAPVGGVLFSIESTKTYFAVRNYWRGFFAAVCGTIFYKGLSQVYHGIDILPMYQEVYIYPLPFNFEFLFISIGIGLLCGVTGPTFVWLHRHLSTLIRRINVTSPKCRCCCAPGGENAKQTEDSGCCGLVPHQVTVFRVMYTVLVCLMVSLALLPWHNGYSFVMSHISTRNQMTDLMANVSWGDPPAGVRSSETAANTSGALLDAPLGNASGNSPLEGSRPRSRSEEILERWTDGFTMDYRASLSIYMLFYFFGVMVCTTLTLPNGAFIPLFKVGVALGRLLGEAYCSHRIAVCTLNSSVAGGLACMTGAAMVASVTHAISVSVIVFELTGQITYVLPVLTSVLVSNALARHLQPSLVDSLTRAKGITVLPKISTSKIAGGYTNVHAKDLMTTDFRVVTQRATLNSLRKLVHQVQNPAKVLPLVNDEVNMEPVGLVHVRRVRRLLREELGNTAWERDKPRFYLTHNAFKTLDWDKVLSEPAVGNLDLEVTTARSPGGSPALQRNPAAPDDGSHPSVYCTVTGGIEPKVRWNLPRRDSSKFSVPRIVVQPASTSQPTSLEKQSSGEDKPFPIGDRRPSAPVVKLSRFSVRKIAEENPLEQVALKNMSTKETQSEKQETGESSVTDSGVDAVRRGSNSSSSSDGSRKDSSAVPLLDVSAGRKPRISRTLRADADQAVYDSLVSNSSRTGKMRNGLVKLMRKSGNLDLETRKQNAEERLQRQFSISDLHQGDGDSIPNMGRLIQKTLDRTNCMFSAMRPTAVQDERAQLTERRLRRAWRRRQLNREVVLRDVIEVDPFPLTVTSETPLVQVHRMFAMLCANKLYVTDRRQLVGCLPLERLAKFITRGVLNEAESMSSPARAVGDPEAPSLGPHHPPRHSRGSQDTLDGLDDSLYDTVMEDTFTAQK